MKGRDLTPLEQQRALQLRALGQSWHAAAKDLDVSPKTLRRQVDPAYRVDTARYEEGRAWDEGRRKRNSAERKGPPAKRSDANFTYTLVERWSSRKKPIVPQVYVDPAEVKRLSAMGLGETKIKSHLLRNYGPVPYKIIREILGPVPQ